MFNDLLSTFVVIVALAVVYLLVRIEQHLSVMRRNFDTHQMNVEDSLKEINYNTEQTVNAVEDLKA